MSIYYDMSINCDLREDTPDEAIDIIRCLTQPGYQLGFTPQMEVPGHGNIWLQFYDKHFLAQQPEHDQISNFHRGYRTTVPKENHREVFQYRLLYCASLIHDDFWIHHHAPFVYWLAQHASNGYIGYYAETIQAVRFNLLVAINRQLRISDR
jgi:hypothetical protein